VRDVPDDVEVGGFVEAVIHFARGLDIIALAEGVETEEQRHFLVDKGCKLGQGYLFSRPVSGNELHALWVATGGRLSGA
jgi:EAL domain-containing protein (putative c-di-GMP-specific phosphodiesterase class I)